MFLLLDHALPTASWLTAAYSRHSFVAGEFIKNNKRAGQIYELHLADNQINDDGALELIQTMKELKHRYPPKREVLGKNGLQLVPVWLRLARNKIKAATLLKSLSATDSRTAKALWEERVKPAPS
eukprot:g26002.t1